MPDPENCKQTLDLTIAVDEVEAETERVVADIQKKAKLPGFRPGKAPLSIIRTRFEGDIRQQVIENLVPKVFHRRAEADNLRIVGQPNISDVHFHKGEPLKFKVEFEVFPEFELGEYRGLTVPYDEPTVTEEEIVKRLDEMRDSKADYQNVDPRPVVNGDHAVVALKSLSGVEGPPVETDEMVLAVGDPDTMPAFTEALLGMSPEEEKEFEITYPDNYGSDRLAGRTVTFHMRLKGIRKKELPELNDEFAADMGDYKSVEELREQVRRDLQRDKELNATQDAKNKLVETLVDAHPFPIPEVFVDRQIEADLQQELRQLAARGVDPSKLDIDWHQLKKSQQERATKQVKASLLLDKVAEREAIETLTEEVDREIHRVAKQVREPAAAIRMRMEKDGSLRKIASRIRTEKTLSFLFENARKVAPESVPAPTPEPES